MPNNTEIAKPKCCMLKVGSKENRLSLPRGTNYEHEKDRDQKKTSTAAAHYIERCCYEDQPQNDPSAGRRTNICATNPTVALSREIYCHEYQTKNKLI